MLFSIETYKARRQEVFSQMRENSVLILVPNPTSVWSNDTDNRYRPNSDVLYLTGFSEAEAILLLSKLDQENSLLGVLPRNPERETWTGKLFGPEAAKNQFGIDMTFPITELSTKIEELLKKSLTVYYRFGTNPEKDNLFIGAFKNAIAGIQRGFLGPREIIDPRGIIHEMRLRKTTEEVEIIRRACEISEDAHIVAMKSIQAGMFEYQIQAATEGEFLRQGGLHPAYPTIAASGSNTCILHYTENTAKLREGELFLLDAGTEYGNYCADITRTYPVDGRFSTIQERVYNIVLDAMNKAIDLCKPGNLFIQVHDIAVEVLTKGLINLKVLDGKLEEMIKEEKFKPFFMHRTSHWLGLDTHDVGQYTRGQTLSNNGGKLKVTSIELEPGMILTVEPGLYFQPQIKEVPTELRGIGIRIEDDILITRDGHMNLTDKVPKKPREIEALMSAG